jgi:hypothetical protein
MVANSHIIMLYRPIKVTTLLRGGAGIAARLSQQALQAAAQLSARLPHRCSILHLQ